MVIKGSPGHPRVENERDVLKRFQDRTTYLRQLIDEVEEPSDPSIIVLKYLEDHLLKASNKKTLNRREIKYVSRRILEALKVLHEDGYVHTGKHSIRNFSCCLTKFKLEDVKLDNVFVNYREGNIRFSDVQLGDLGGTYPADSKLCHRRYAGRSAYVDQPRSHYGNAVEHGH